MMLVALARRIPMVRLAPLLGLSDSGLAKHFRRDWIDHASRGHWARREHGKPVPRFRLRGPRSTWREVIEFGAGAKDRDDARRDDELIDLLHRDAEAPWAVVPENLRNAHPLTHRGAPAAARRPHLGDENLPGIAADAVLEVPRSQQARARRFVSGLLDALQDRRISVRLDRRRSRPAPEVTILGVKMRLLVTFQRTAPSGDAVLDDRPGSRSRDRELVLHARLACATSGPCWGGAGRRRIEGRVDEIVADLVAMAVEERGHVQIAEGAADGPTAPST